MGPKGLSTYDFAIAHLNPELCIEYWEVSTMTLFLRVKGIVF